MSKQLSGITEKPREKSIKALFFHSLVVIILGGSVPATASQQSAFICNNRVIDHDDTAVSVQNKCGKPLSRQGISKNKQGKLEQWTYSQGRGRFFVIITLQGGKVIRIESGGREE
jgi:hypothetical protein